MGNQLTAREATIAEIFTSDDLKFIRSLSTQDQLMSFGLYCKINDFFDWLEQWQKYDEAFGDEPPILPIFRKL